MLQEQPLVQLDHFNLFSGYLPTFAQATGQLSTIVVDIDHVGVHSCDKQVAVGCLGSRPYSRKMETLIED